MSSLQLGVGGIELVPQSTGYALLIGWKCRLAFYVFKTNINPKASGKKLVKVSHLTVASRGCFITGIALALDYGGTNMTGIVLPCPGIVPLALTLLWSGQTRLAAMLSPILVFFTGLAIWLGTSKALCGESTWRLPTWGVPALYGATASFFSPTMYSVLISHYMPYKFD
ncbi:uncharacterized protein N0V89_003396 [Didymosphaeria variabile]|uniref:Uncharacterized protein n=1 Tax=Didymosphaeria variabile TaxID=1932322 RepID=A0A9W8XMK0_9PLEO|nr:uncharacterized protein N0V89_003396 [Didymosphaeria variabile]KAJ4355380.1 hypothetical protein N0V89_003396 [Didymosphaeria variabile]